MCDINNVISNFFLQKYEVKNVIFSPCIRNKLTLPTWEASYHVIFKIGEPSCAGFPIYLYLLRCTKACWADYGNLVTSGWNIKVKLPCFTSVKFVNNKNPIIDYPWNFHLPEDESLLSSWPTAFRVCLPSWSLQNLFWPSGHACRLVFVSGMEKSIVSVESTL